MCVHRVIDPDGFCWTIFVKRVCGLRVQMQKTGSGWFLMLPGFWRSACLYPRSESPLSNIQAKAMLRLIHSGRFTVTCKMTYQSYLTVSSVTKRIHTFRQLANIWTLFGYCTFVIAHHGIMSKIKMSATIGQILIIFVTLQCVNDGVACQGIY